MKSKARIPFLFLALFCFTSMLLTSAESKKGSLEESKSSFLPPDADRGYTINFNNVPIIELIKFISKIGSVNFIYDSSDLNFNVTIISEEPTHLSHVMAAFIQVLRIHGFDLIEQGNNLVITNKGESRQIATVVSDEFPLNEAFIPPIMTRVFSVKNSNPATLAGLVRPLLSSNAIVEVSETTRHIIITDITQNIEEVHKLFYSLDIPKSSLTIDSYSSKNNAPETLISLANQILIPISEGNPLIFVPQASTDTIFIVSTPFLIEKSIEILEDLDAPPSLTRDIQGPITGQNILLYHIKNKAADVLMKTVNEVKNDLSQAGPSSKNIVSTLNTMKLVRNSHSLLFVGGAQALIEVQKILESLDIPYSEQELEFAKGDFYIYHIKYGDESQIESSLKKLVKNLKSASHPDSDLIEAIETMKYIPENGSLTFTGDRRSLNKIKEILPTFDLTPELSTDHFFIYDPKNESAEVLLKLLHDTYKNLKNSNLTDKGFLKTLNSATISSGGRITFTGDEQSLDRIRALVAMMDQPKGPSKELTYLYQIEYVQPEYIEKGLQQFAKSIPSNDPLAQTIDNMKYIKQSNSLVFRGTEDTVEHLKTIISTLDNAKAAEQALAPKTSAFFVYTPTSKSATDFQKGIIAAAKEMQSSGLEDPPLIECMESAKVVSNSTAVMFTGTSEAIEKIKTLAQSYDAQQKEAQKSHYFIFKPQYQTPKEIITQAIHTADEMKEQGFADPSLIIALNSARLVSQGTGVLFTGTDEAITRVKDLVLTFDIPVEIAPAADQVHVYKPIHISAEDLRKYTAALAEDMEKSGFSNPGLIHTLKNTRLVSGGKAVLFTGSKESIQKLEDLLPSLDSPSDETITKIGKTTFVIYKLKYIAGPALMGYLRNIASDLKTVGSTQDDLILTLNNMRYVDDTKSMIFTGTPQAVQEAVALAQKFDIPGLAQETPVRLPSGYLIYKPKHVPGEELIRVLRDFEQNLRTSGVADKELFDVITHLKWMERTSSILISGQEKESEKVYGLLERFDVPGPGAAAGTSDIETVSDTSFLIYKLQYHSGGEIQSAVKLIGADLAKTETKGNDALTQAINTLQWIEVTNSLIATGQADALAKLRELIKGIDIPLKQVFVEVLVIETNNTNNLTFGLHWGSQGNYRNKFAYGFYNNPQSTTNNVDPLISFSQNLSTITGTTTPTGSMIPVPSGSDLGIIGDIILHKGQTYFALGSLLNALKVEGDSTVVMNQKIITQDNKMSSIFSGQNIPYTGSTVSNQGTNTVNTANLEYRDVGVSLSITPFVGNNDIITLMIEEDISEVVSGTENNNTTGQVQGITTNKTTTKTVVSVPDKSFLVLSGSMQNSTTHARTSHPCLGGLPLIGAAFTQNETDQTLENLIIFIRPQIIKSFNTYADITERQEDLHRSQTADAESFDAGLELVKTPDDTY